MNFRRGWLTDEPEINLIPMIDILLVIVIFLMVSSRLGADHGLRLQLPQGGRPQAAAQHPHEIDVQQNGEIRVDGATIGSLAALPNLLAQWERGGRSAPVVVAADARVSHGQVMAVLDQLQRAGQQHLVLRTADH